MDKKINQRGLRKRGRPAGKHRVALSLEERRARNAQYERERRAETSEALADLAEAAGCESSSTMPDILASVIMQLWQTTQVDHNREVEYIKRCNEYYAAQITELEQRLVEPKDCPSTSMQNLTPDWSRPVKWKRCEFEEKTVPIRTKASSYVQEQDYVYHGHGSQSLLLQSPSSAIDQLSPPQPQYTQLNREVPAQENVGLIQVPPVPLDSILPSIVGAEFDESRIHFQSEDELIAHYLV